MAAITLCNTTVTTRNLQQGESSRKLPTDVERNYKRFKNGFTAITFAAQTHGATCCRASIHEFSAILQQTKRENLWGISFYNCLWRSGIDLVNTKSSTRNCGWNRHYDAPRFSCRGRDEVKLYDGTDGYIHRLGWVSSTIRG